MIGVEETCDLVGLNPKKYVAIAYEIPYFEIDGSRAEFSRWKLLQAGETDLPMKYYQEEKTIPRMYMPPLLDWQALAKDPTRRIVITEGEKKAACACIHKIPCLGLGGVWNWKSKKWGYEEIPDFSLFMWKGRTVEICFDGDMMTNENVHRAMQALTTSLTKLGASVFIRYLPKMDGKSALDDFLLQSGAAKYEELRLEEAPQSSALSELNHKIAYVEKLNCYVSLEDGQLYRTEAELERRYGTTKIIADSGKLLKATSVWTAWPHRRTILDVTYDPGKPRIHENKLNDWRGWGATPKRGDVSLLLEVIKSVEEWEWLLKWLAYPIQHPGAKMFTAVLLWAVQQRTGKSLIGDVMRRIYGEANSSYITSADLQDAGHDWLARKQFVHGDEVMMMADKADFGILRTIITGDVVRVNIKYVPKHSVPNRANLFLTSNQPDAIRMDKDDRRMFVGELAVQRPDKFWKDMERWSAAGGAAAFMWYLQNQVDCASFDPSAPAPLTEVKQEMIHAGASDLDQWAMDLIANPDSLMQEEAHKQMRKRDVFTVTELMSLLPKDLQEQRWMRATHVGRALTKAGAVRCGVVRTGDGKSKRLTAIKNVRDWRAKRREIRLWAQNYDRGRETQNEIARMRANDRKKDEKRKATVTQLRPRTPPTGGKR